MQYASFSSNTHILRRCLHLDGNGFLDQISSRFDLTSSTEPSQSSIGNNRHLLNPGGRHLHVAGDLLRRARPYYTWRQNVVCGFRSKIWLTEGQTGDQSIHGEYKPFSAHSTGGAGTGNINANGADTDNGDIGASTDSSGIGASIVEKKRYRSPARFQVRLARRG